MSSSVKYFGLVKKYDKKMLIIMCEGKIVRVKWYYCKLGNIIIGWIDLCVFMNVGKLIIVDIVLVFWNSKKVIIIIKLKNIIVIIYFF